MSINIDMKKVDEKIVDKYLAQLKITARGGLNAKVNALEKQQREQTPDSDISTPCTNCGGISDCKLPECPYCGEADSGDALATPSVDVGPATVEQTTADDQARAAQNAEASAETAPEVKAEVVKTTKKQKLAKVERAKKDADPVAHAGEIVGSKDLDDAVLRVHSALRQGAGSYWELGKALGDIFDRQLWKQRLAGGKQRHQSWAIFCRDELGMSHVNTFSVMDAARYASKEDFEEIGHTKLQLLLRLPKQRQEELREAARRGQLPRAKLKQIIEQEVPKGAVRDTGRAGRATAAHAAAAAVAGERRAARKLPKPDGELVAIAQLGRSTLKLLARPSGKNPKGKPVRATSLRQDPWCEHELPNGVVARYAVVSTPNGINLVVEYRRGEASPAAAE